MNKRKKIVCTIAILFAISNSIFTEDFEPIFVLKLEDSYSAQYELETNEEVFEDEKNNRIRKDYIYINDYFLPGEKTIVFALDVDSVREIVRIGNKYFTNRAVIPNQPNLEEVWRVDLDNNTVTYLLNTYDYAVSKSGRYMVIIEPNPSESYIEAAEVRVIDLEENEYVWEYNIENEVRNLYKNNEDVEYVALILTYDRNKTQFVVNAQGIYYKNGFTIYDEPIEIYLDQIFE